MTESRFFERENTWWTPRLAAPVAAAAAVRMALLAATLARSGTTVIASGDTASYLEPGRNLLFHGQFVVAGVAEIGRTPGYALFLALASWPSPVFAAILQVCLSAFSVVLVWRLARAALLIRPLKTTVSVLHPSARAPGPEHPAFLSPHESAIRQDHLFHAGSTANDLCAFRAAWIFAFEPVSVIYSVRLLPETLYLVLLLLSLERLAAFLRDRRLPALAGCGIALAAATLVRPVSVYLPALLALGLFLICLRVSGLRWKAPAVLLLAALPWLALWQMRNAREAGFEGFSSIATRNLYFYQAAEVTARVSHRPFIEVQREFGYPDEREYQIHHPDQSQWSQAQRLDFMQAEANRILRANPWIYLREQAEGSLVAAFTPCAAELLRLLDAYPQDGAVPRRVVDEGVAQSALRLAKAHPWQTVVMATLESALLVLLFFAAKGVVRVGMRNRCLLLLLAVAFYFLMVSGGAQAVGRYRLPVMPIVCMLAAVGCKRNPAF